MAAMWWRSTSGALIVVLLAAISLAGCVASLNKDSSFSSNGQMASNGTAPQIASNGLAPQIASDGIAPRRAGAPASGHSQPAGVAPVALVSTDGAYRIGALDVLDISVFKVPELSKSVQVSDTGTINLPLVGEVPAAGKTAQEVERDLTAKLGAKYLQNPQVTVLVKENNSQRVTIEGAVKVPGIFPIKTKTSLLQVVAMAQGFDPNSDSTVLVLRTTDGKRSAAKFNVSDIQSGSAEDPTMQSGDVIVAGTSAIKAGFNSVLKVLPIAGLFAFL
jgi:polysaccharide export outer membrane protein